MPLLLWSINQRDWEDYPVFRNSDLFLVSEKQRTRTSRLIMVYRRSRWSLWSLLTVVALLSFAKSSIIANNTAVRIPDTGSKCNVYNTYNYYNSHLNTGSNKKMEALLHRILNELSEVREEITLLKANKTTGKYVFKQCAPLRST